MDDDDSTREGTNRLLKGLLQEVLSGEAAPSDQRAEQVERREPELPGSSESAFGWGMFGVTVFTLLVGAYPLPVGLGTRAMFLLFAMVELIVTVYFLDKGRRLKRSRAAGSKDPQRKERASEHKGRRSDWDMGRWWLR